MVAVLRQGEHIPKMQNDIGRNSRVRVLRQLRRRLGAGRWSGRYGGGGGTLAHSRAILRDWHKFTLNIHKMHDQLNFTHNQKILYVSTTL